MPCNELAVLACGCGLFYSSLLSVLHMCTSTGKKAPPSWGEYLVKRSIGMINFSSMSPLAAMEAWLSGISYLDC
jgi:hypothetical protein